MTIRLVTLAPLAVLLMASLASAQPSLWFTKADLPRLRAACEAEPLAGVWKATLARAEGYCDPKSPDYARPEALARPPAGEVKVQVVGHYYGRRLTDWMEALGFAYQVTGEERFARHGVLLLEAAAKELPVTRPEIAAGFAGARGDLMRGLAVGYDWLGEAMTPEQKALWAQTAAGYVRNLVAEFGAEKTWWRPYHNFMGVAMGAAGLLSLELRQPFPEEAPGWLRTCTEAVGLWLDRGWDEDGAYVESTMYGIYGLTNAIRFADALKRSGGEDLFTRPHLQRVPNFYAMSLLPGERVFEARNDADYGPLSDPTLLRLAEALHSGLARWVWDHGGSGDSVFRLIWTTAPAPVAPEATAPAAHFRGRGLCVWRTGWTAADVMFSIECGPFYAVTHNQADEGSFTLYGLGQRWAIDSGYGNNRIPGGRDSSHAHNMVLIDGEGGAPSGAGAGTSGTITYCENTAVCGTAGADATESYNHNNHGQPGVGVQHARRHVCFLRPSAGAPAYAVVLDDIRKDDAPHDYAWQLHLPGDMQVRAEADGALLTPGSAAAATFLQTPLAATGRGEAAWKVTVPQEGDYVLWGQVRATGPEPGKADSFFVQVDAGPQVDWHMPGGREWTWGKVSKGVAQEPFSVHLSAGEHTVKFLTRESGAQLQQAALTADAKAVPPFAPGAALPLSAKQASVTAPLERTELPGDPQAPRLRLWLSGAAPVRLETDGYDGHQRLKGHVQAVAPEFAAVLVPLPAGVPEPQVKVTREGGAVRVQVAWAGRSDEILWPAEGERKPVVRVR